MDFWRLRGVAYLVGALEFGCNVRDNLFNTHKVFREEPAQSERTFAGKTVIVTGGSTGIGLALSEALALRGAGIILACLSVEEGRAAAQDIAKAAARQHRGDHAALPEVDVWELDLANLASVRAVARRFCKEDRQLDLLVCNAGIMAPNAERHETADGLELQFQVNYLGHWMLAHMLLGHQRSRRGLQTPSQSPGEQAPELKNASASSTARDIAEGMRVIFLSSTTHRAGSLDWSDLQLRTDGVYTGFKGYANSKLAVLLAAREFQLRLNRNGGHRADAAVAVHPGLVNTQLARDWVTGEDVSGKALHPYLAPVMRALAPWLLVPPACAVDTLLFAATAPAHQVAGRYISSGRAVPPAQQALDDNAAAMLWDASCQLTGMSTHANLR